jgi:hypothetical protein
MVTEGLEGMTVTTATKRRPENSVPTANSHRRGRDAVAAAPLADPLSDPLTDPLVQSAPVSTTGALTIQRKVDPTLAGRPIQLHGNGKNGKKKEPEPLGQNDSEWARKAVAAAGDWEAVKDKYVPEPAKMGIIVRYRKEHVDGIVAKLKSKKGLEKIKPLAAGSEALTSDYDITFLGPSSIQAVVEFNKAFTGIWKKEAGTVFDTNVYAQNFLEQKKGEQEPFPVDVKASKDSDMAIQDAMSLAKVRKNMSKKQWKAFVDRVLVAMTNPERKINAKQQYDKADSIYMTTYVSELIGKLAKLAPKEVKKLREAGKKDAQIVDALVGGATGMSASNRLYEDKLVAVEKLVKKRDEAMESYAKKKDPVVQKRIAKLTVEIREAHSKALLFANEPYFASGTIRHVVGNVQLGWALDLGTDELFQSFNENFGDTLKEIHHQRKKPFADAAIKSSKYVYRFTTAAMELSRKSKAIKVPDYTAELEKQSGNVLHIRQGETLERNLKKTDYGEAGMSKKRLDALDFMSRVGIKSIDTLKSKVMRINVLVNASARSRKKK